MAKYMSDLSLPLFERIMARVERRDGCLMWQGATTRGGYGRIVFKRRYYYVHRAVWAHFNGPIPDGYDVCHSCDTPGCCDIEHLWAGTAKDNIQDSVRKGRHGVKGCKGPRLLLRDREYCCHGHKLSDVGVGEFMSRGRPVGYCRECSRIKDRARKRVRHRTKR